ncbi:MAG TPA: LacI family DNA-binding transcriptional regulator, partial [Tepidisphaeraceae bacterium]|nr:LacI family DNA-binding transcriptional regulator [Tepidisphaeraceae bacterium]
MATLQDIADRVGVSTVTVSKVLRGKVKGSWARSAERVQQIHKVAEELGYQVDWRARALKTRRTHMIGLLNTDRPETRLHDPRLLSGLIETLGNAGYSAVFYRVPGKRTHASFADT